MTIRAVLFDIDGTLIDSNDAHIRAWAEAFLSVGARFSDQAIHDQIGKGADGLIPALMPGASQAQQEALSRAQGDVFKSRYLKQVQPFSGARDLLARVHQAGQRIVLASSASKAELDYYVGLLGAREMVDDVTTADDVEQTKPAPDIPATALRKVAPLPASEVIMVGDTPYDAEAAAKCGIATVAVRSGKFSDQALRQAGAVAIYDDVASLLAGYSASPLAQ